MDFGLSKNATLTVLLALAVLLAGCAAPMETAEPGQVDQSTTTVMQDVTPTTQVAAEGDVVTFQLTGENFAFFMDGEEQPELHVKQGDTVRIELTSTDGFHDWVVDEFDAATDRVRTGETATVEFVADQTGTFEYYCSVGSHRANGMWGNLVVE